MAGRTEHWPDPRREDEWVAVARLTRVRGNRGELAAIPLSSHPERFERLEEVVLAGGRAFPDDPRFFVVEDVWEHGARLVFKFQGVESISEAGELVGAEVRIPVSERMPLEAGEYYQSDLVGCEVVDRATGDSLGRVTAWLDIGGAGTLQVRRAADGGELLVPFARAVCVGIDVESGRIEVELPDGLMDLNG